MCQRKIGGHSTCIYGFNYQRVWFAHLNSCCQQSRVQQRTNPPQQAAYQHDSNLSEIQRMTWMRLPKCHSQRAVELFCNVLFFLTVLFVSIRNSTAPWHAQIYTKWHSNVCNSSPEKSKCTVLVPKTAVMVWLHLAQLGICFYAGLGELRAFEVGMSDNCWCSIMPPSTLLEEYECEQNVVFCMDLH